jgi:hypothetical protein
MSYMARSNKFATSFNIAINEPSSRGGATKQANIAHQSKKCATVKRGIFFGMSYITIDDLYYIRKVVLVPLSFLKHIDFLLLAARYRYDKK